MVVARETTLTASVRKRLEADKRVLVLVATQRDAEKLLRRLHALGVPTKGVRVVTPGNPESILGLRVDEVVAELGAIDCALDRGMHDWLSSLDATVTL